MPDASPAAAESTGLRPDSFGTSSAGPVTGLTAQPPAKSLTAQPPAKSLTVGAPAKSQTAEQPAPSAAASATPLPEHELVAPKSSTPPVSEPVAAPSTAEPVPHVTLPEQPIARPRLRLPQLHGRFVVPITDFVVPATDFAAADVRRLALPTLMPVLRRTRLLVPAALALLVLVAASGSFLSLVYRMHREQTGVS